MRSKAGALYEIHFLQLKAQMHQHTAEKKALKGGGAVRLYVAAECGACLLI